MTDEKRSYNMSRIKGKDTSIEIALSKALWHRGFHLRRGQKGIYGHPDISSKKLKVAIFCDGDFWHGWDWEERRDRIKSNQSYWIPKIEHNMEKDDEVNHHLLSQGWLVIRVWEHEIRKDITGTADMISRLLKERKESL